MRVKFFIKNFQELVLDLTAEEMSGAVEPHFFENYYGLDSALTLRHVQSNRTFNIGIYATTFNKFEGTYPINMLPMGLYRLEGRIRDRLYRYAIITDFHEELAEPVQPIEMLLEPGYGATSVISVSGVHRQTLDSTAEYGIIIQVVGKNRQIAATGGYFNMVEVRGHYDGTLGDLNE